MLNDIKSTSKHSTVYIIGSIAVKIIGVILIPLYTNPKYLSYADYGVLAVLEATQQLLVGLLSMAMTTSLSRWYYDKKFADKQKSVFFTSYAFLALTIIPTIILLAYLAPYFSNLLFSSIDYSYLLILTICSAGLQVLNNQFLYLAKIQLKSVFFSGVQIVKLVIILGLILWGIIVKKKGLEAIWEAQLIGEGITLLILLPYTIKNSVLKFHREVLVEMLSYGFPLMLASVSTVILAVADRYMLSSMSGLEKTGIYSLGYRIANTLQLVIAASLTAAILPIKMKKIDDFNNQRFYAKSFTYLGYIFVFALLGLSLFSLEALKLFTSSAKYWEANNIVSILAFSLLFSFLKDHSNMGLIITKKTKILGLLIFITSVLNIALNLVLIPKWDIYGAAFATLISQLFFFITASIVSQKAYYIPYEWRKIGVLILLSLVFIALGLLISDKSIWIRMFVKLSLFISFPFVLGLFGFYEKVEIETIKKIFGKWQHPKDFLENIKRLFKT